MFANRLKKRAMDAAVIVLVIAAILHFSHRAILGESGRYAQRDVNREIEALTAEKTALREERARLANLTRRLGADYLDLDLLDEQAREILGHIRSDEVVIR